jgi:hypothetical protein
MVGGMVECWVWPQGTKPNLPHIDCMDKHFNMRLLPTRPNSLAEFFCIQYINISKHINFFDICLVQHILFIFSIYV